MVSIHDQLLHLHENQGNNDPEDVTSCLENVNQQIREREGVHKDAEPFVAIFQNAEHEEHVRVVQNFFEKFIKIGAKHTKRANSNEKKQNKRRGKNNKKKDAKKENSVSKMRKRHASLNEKAEWLLQQHKENANVITVLKQAAEILQEILEAELSGNKTAHSNEVNAEQSVDLPFVKKHEEITGEDSIAGHETHECDIHDAEESIHLGGEEKQKEFMDQQAIQEDTFGDGKACNSSEEGAVVCDKGLVDAKDKESTDHEKLLAFCQSICPSTDINGNKVPLSTRRRARMPVQPQLCELENPNDPNLKCSTCDKVIGNDCALCYCRPCQQVRICDNKNCAILHHCKIRKPKHFCFCGKDAMFFCSRCGIKSHCSKTCQCVDWKCHKAECELPLID